MRRAFLSTIKFNDWGVELVIERADIVWGEIGCGFEYPRRTDKHSAILTKSSSPCRQARTALCFPKVRLTLFLLQDDAGIDHFQALTFPIDEYRVGIRLGDFVTQVVDHAGIAAEQIL